MEFIRKDIHTSILKGGKYSQLTIDEDFNIPDNREDIDKIIAGNGYAVVEEVTCEDGRVKVIGTVHFKALYKTVNEDNAIEAYEGEIPFEDNVNVDGISKNNHGNNISRLEDLTVSMINSRKLQVRGLIGNEVSVYESESINGAVDLENGQGIDCRYNNVTMTEVVIDKQDIFKIKEDVEIPQSKPNIKEIVWASVELRNLESKARDNLIDVRGEVEIFVIYKSSEEHLPVQYLFSVRTISKEIACQGAVEDMVLEADIMLGKGDVGIRQDGDGEDRIIGVDYSVNMNIKLYQEETIKLLEDLYSPQAELVPEREKLHFENLLMRNCIKTKVSERKRIMNEEQKFLQVCHIFGNVDIDEVKVNNDEIEITGVVKTSVMYISTGDDPMSCMDIDIPFEYKAGSEFMDWDRYGKQINGSSVRVTPCLDMLNATLMNSEEIEVKAVINLGISVFTRDAIMVITDMEVSPIDYDRKAAMPGIVGYIVQKGDSVWSIARKYYSTLDSIRSVNKLETDDIKEGDKLIIVKS